MDYSRGSMSRSGVEPRSTHDGVGAVEGWGRASLKALAVWVCALAGLVLIPDRLIAYLSLHVSPPTRDLLVLLSFVIAFLLVGWLFVRLQRQRAG